MSSFFFKSTKKSNYTDIFQYIKIKDELDLKDPDLLASIEL